MRHLFATIAAAALAAACSRSDDAGERALAVGTYQVDAPLCASTGQPPAYPAASYKAALYDFDGLKTHTLAIGRFVATETVQDEDCTVVVTRPIHTNADGIYSLALGRHHSFTPEGCALSVVIHGVTYVVGKATTDLFTDSDDAAEEAPYNVESIEGGVQLTSEDRSDLNDVWGAYGCAKPDRLRRVLH